MAEGRSRQRSTVLLSRERPKMGPPRRVRPQLEESNDEIESDLKNKETGESLSSSDIKGNSTSVAEDEDEGRFHRRRTAIHGRRPSARVREETGNKEPSVSQEENLQPFKEEEDQFQPIRRGSRLVSDARRRRYLQSKDDHEEVSPDRHSLSGSVEPATDVPQNFEETSDQPQPSRPSSKPTLAENVKEKSDSDNFVKLTYEMETNTDLLPSAKFESEMDSPAPEKAVTETTMKPDTPTPAPDKPTSALDRPTSAPDRPTSAPDMPTSAPDRPTSAPDMPTSAPDMPTSATDRLTPAPDRPTSAPDRPTPAPDTSTPAPDTPTPAPDPIPFASTPAVTPMPIPKVRGQPLKRPPSSGEPDEKKPEERESFEFEGNHPKESIRPRAKTRKFNQPKADSPIILGSSSSVNDALSPNQKMEKPIDSPKEEPMDITEREHVTGSEAKEKMNEQNEPRVMSSKESTLSSPKDLVENSKLAPNYEECTLHPGEDSRVHVGEASLEGVEAIDPHLEIQIDEDREISVSEEGEETNLLQEVAGPQNAQALKEQKETGKAERSSDHPEAIPINSPLLENGQEEVSLAQNNPNGRDTTTTSSPANTEVEVLVTTQPLKSTQGNGLDTPNLQSMGDLTETETQLPPTQSDQPGQLLSDTNDIPDKSAPQPINVTMDTVSKESQPKNEEDLLETNGGNCLDTASDQKTSSTDTLNSGLFPPDPLEANVSSNPTSPLPSPTAEIDIKTFNVNKKRLSESENTLTEEIKETSSLKEVESAEEKIESTEDDLEPVAIRRSARTISGGKRPDLRRLSRKAENTRPENETNIGSDPVQLLDHGLSKDSKISEKSEGSSMVGNMDLITNVTQISPPVTVTQPSADLKVTESSQRKELDNSQAVDLLQGSVAPLSRVDGRRESLEKKENTPPIGTNEELPSSPSHENIREKSPLPSASENVDIKNFNLLQAAECKVTVNKEDDDFTLEPRLTRGSRVLSMTERPSLSMSRKDRKPESTGTASKVEKNGEMDYSMEAETGQPSPPNKLAFGNEEPPLRSSLKKSSKSSPKKARIVSFETEERQPPEGDEPKIIPPPVQLRDSHRKIDLISDPSVLVNRTYKVIIVGSSGVGKTCLLHRLSTDTFCQNYTATLGVDFKLVKVHYNNKVVAVKFWDTAGQERFRSLTRSYFQGAHGIIVMYDVTYEPSFSNIREWVTSISDTMGEVPPLLIVGNKTDLKANRIVEYNSGTTIAGVYKAKYIEMSCKSGENVGNGFYTLLDQIIAAEDSGKYPKAASTVTAHPRGLQQENKIIKGSSGCCS